MTTLTVRSDRLLHAIRTRTTCAVPLNVYFDPCVTRNEKHADPATKITSGPPPPDGGKRGATDEQRSNTRG